MILRVRPTMRALPIALTSRSPPSAGKGNSSTDRLDNRDPAGAKQSAAERSAIERSAIERSAIGVRTENFDHEPARRQDVAIPDRSGSAGEGRSDDVTEVALRRQTGKTRHKHRLLPICSMSTTPDTMVPT